MSTKHNQLDDDPRNSALETPLVLPKTWHHEVNEGSPMSGMFISMLIMVTRNRYLAWPSTLFGIASLINEHPMRSESRTLRGWSNLALSLSALVASYIPIFVISKK